MGRYCARTARRYGWVPRHGCSVCFTCSSRSSCTRPPGRVPALWPKARIAARSPTSIRNIPSSGTSTIASTSARLVRRPTRPPPLAVAHRACYSGNAQSLRVALAITPEGGNMRIGVALCLGLCSAALCACTPEHAPPDRPSSGSPILLDQGAGWTDATRADFYSRDQGSQIMPLAWLTALEQPSGTPFLADSLGRYGYLANPANNNGLPVGFTAAGPEGSEIAGMTCAACHTRQIERRRRPSTASTAARRSWISRASSPISTRPSARSSRATLPSTPSPGRGAGRHGAARRRGGAAPGGRALVPALPHADDPRPARRSPGARDGSTRWR